MAYDPQNPTDVAALKTEITTDPIGMGYIIGHISQTTKALNDPEANIGGDTTGATLTVELLLDAMVPSELSGTQTDDGGRVFVAALLGRDLGFVVEPWRQKIIDSFSNNSVTESNIDALTRRISRAEVLFGIGTVLTKDDVHGAENS